ncbi:Uncharacterised protein [Enterobacter cloacae]|uniref:hypothetical protein n=1 Tax=Enterobacter cloacae TaxID=550 RepID=UPI000793E54F|nr:hypothetical protein [Enterobacter cloacae]SAE06318.1 Uncharacterised protein [Enterobacter cloacae]
MKKVIALVTVFTNRDIEQAMDVTAFKQTCCPIARTLTQIDTYGVLGRGLSPGWRRAMVDFPVPGRPSKISNIVIPLWNAETADLFWEN